MYGILSQTNSTLLTADMVLHAQKNLCLIHDVYSPAGSVLLSSHLTFCTPTKSNLYFDSSFDTVLAYLSYTKI
jgi:hypothetical protein